MKNLVHLICVIGLLFCLSTSVWAQHDHGHAGTEAVEVPKVFLDKSPRIVEYQLKRLSNAQLLLIETQTDDGKYAPVYSAILSREGMSPADREQALAGLVAINQTTSITELVKVLLAVPANNEAGGRIIKGIAKILFEQPASDLAQESDVIGQLTDSPNPLLPPIGYAAMILGADQRLPSDSPGTATPPAAWEYALSREQVIPWLKSIALVPNGDLRLPMHEQVMQLTDVSQPIEVRLAAVTALSAIAIQQENTFASVADLVVIPELQDAAIRTLLSVPREHRAAGTSLQLIEWLVDHAEQTPPADRTGTAFLDALELVDQLLGQVPTASAKPFRERLRETVVRVVRIHTVEEEMRYDIEYFAVEAGRPVQLVLINEDLMPHNVVITAPGALKEVADAALLAGPDGGRDGKQYVPDRPDVLFATNMVGARESERLTFTAPEVPGEYPFVCTFPNHWMRMYGVMVVVADLDAWQRDPVVPKDPIGSNRSFVQSWKMSDFNDSLAKGLEGRSPAIGERLFVEATCALCHKAGGHTVGNVGPELNQLFAKWKGDSRAILQEIIDPSHRIDENYAVHQILTIDGDALSGLIVQSDKDTISILQNPDAKEPTVINRDDIDEMVKTSVSMMPKSLLDRFSRDEVYEIMAYLKSIQVP
ncbi:plastocyanin/azurin family copper-binding protein [Aureliella helgolandensis]|uniref:Auracyanin-B n=1 Tax=Aureliella helgolandensis TaxID=2527968 RepID=A0A518G4F1_9BACT|nr:plastocyanin/azurin family copper-binding protein [Aureliella helgolandensis]QDV23476.1 Auracyanin-B precursor [Aureliella helgolandensis]